MVIVFAINAFRRLPSGMPLVSTCSVAISAACHRPVEDVDAHLLPVQWGVVTADDEKVGRCAFTTLRTVHPPDEGQVYTGLAI